MILNTDRLQIKDIKPSDASFFLEILNTDSWIKNIGQRNIQTIEDAETYTLNLIEQYNKTGIGFKLVWLKGKDVCVGMVGFVDRPGLEGVDVGYAVLPRYEGKGYTTEAVLEIMKYGKNEMKLKEILGVTSIENVASQKILKKVGLSFVKMFIMEGYESEESMLFSTKQP